ncbi:MAG TPA: AAA family ATPase [Candidatus Limnocylindrales bacterium]|nr:AAA family ATPase [Candidatus Limnocylindrales bacterium]
MAATIEIPIVAPGLVVLVGAAGSGKSTFAARHFRPDEILSSDALRERLTGDPGDQTATRLAFAILHRELVNRLRAGRLVVVDATSVRPFARRALVRRAATLGAEATAVILDLPADVVHTRNLARPRPVPVAAVDAQLAELARGLTGIAGEGFQRVVRLATPDEVDAVRLVRTAGGP